MIDIKLSELLIYRKSSQEKIKLNTPSSVDNNGYQIIKQDALKALMEVSNNKELLFGIVFSTDFLFESLNKYFFRSNFQNLNKKERQSYKGLLNYSTRAAHNSTPFNLFTEIGLIHFDDDIIDHPESKIRVEMNMFIIKHVIDVLVAYFYKFDLLKLELNPTISKSENKLYFYYPSNGDVSFSNINANAFVDFIIEVFNKKGTYTYQELLQLTQKTFENDEAELRKIFEYFVKEGLLNVEIGINFLSSENRLGDFITFIESLDDSSNGLHKLVTVLLELEKLISTTETLPSPNIVNEELNSIHIKFSQVMHSLAEYVGIENYRFPFKKYNLIYVDLFGQNRNASFTERFVKDQLVLIEKLLWKFQIFDDNVIERKKCYDFFLKKYDKSENVSFRDFYVEYHRSSSSKDNSELDKMELVGKQTAFSNLIKDYLINLEKSNTGNIHIDVNEIPSSITPFPIFLDSKSSHCVYFSHSNSAKFYLQSISTGFGRAESRFLLGFEEKYGKKIKEANISFFSPNIVFENNDLNFFNANLHCELADFEIEVQNNHSYSIATNKLNVNDIFVALRDEKLVLIDKFGKQVIPINISLQAEEQRSLLFNFISLFNYQKKIDLSIINTLWTEINISKSEGVGVVEVPSLLIEDKLILFTKFWIIRYEINEIYNLSLPDNERYNTLMSFFDKNKIPYFGFIQFEDEIRFSEPFYYDLANPIYFELFEKNALGKQIIVFHEDVSKLGKAENYITTYYSNNDVSLY